jgi:hypothetical protein
MERHESAESLPSKCSIWRLHNPLETAKFGPNLAVVSLVSPAEGLQGHKPLLFLHGVEYQSPREVIHDFIHPFLSCLLQEEHSFLEPVYFASWNSKLFQVTTNSIKHNSCKRLSLASVIGRLPFCRYYLRDVEQRAKDAAVVIASFVERLVSGRNGLQVISHSLGAKVWADTLVLLSQRSSQEISPGTWWNLQPALPHYAFSAGSEYDVIPKMYLSCINSRYLAWFSKIDFVLSTLFILAKRARAMGQFGCKVKILPERDVTRWVKEAHGMNHVRGKLGTFFKRAGGLIPQEAKNLGIVF